MICDYEGSDYQSRFWRNADRAYEDAVERIAIRKLLPPNGKRVVEIGAAFGRLADLYNGYDEIILFDYSRSLLEQARERYGNDPRFKFVVGNAYELPFAEGVMSSATMVRVLHHMKDAPTVMRQIRRIVAPNGAFVMEYANKRNFKAIARYALGKQKWNPNTQEPVEFVELNFDFHPTWIQRELRQAGFNSTKQVPVSHLRAGVIKRTLPLNAMVKVDSALQRISPLYSPSVFTFNQPIGTNADNQSLSGDAIFADPRTKSALHRDGDMLVSAEGNRYRVDGNLYDFKGTDAS